MLQDFNAHRPLEVESIVGSPVKIARKNGVRAPMLETVYALMKLITRKK
jgi:ketopantoate reductase